MSCIFAKNIFLKTLITYLFLFCFSLRPAYYVGQLLYFELNLNEIVEKYCVNKDKPEFQCNGKCQLAKQLQETSNENDNSSKSLNVLSDSFLPVFISKNQNYTFTNNSEFTLKKTTFSYANTYFYQYNSVSFKPPIA